MRELSKQNSARSPQFMPRAIAPLLVFLASVCAADCAFAQAELSSPTLNAPALSTFEQSVPSTSPSPEGHPVAQALATTGSVVFRDTTLAEVILILSEQWDVNIVAGSDISGTISGTFKNERLEKILDSLLTANGFQYRQIGNSLVVVGSGDTGSGKPNFIVEVVQLPANSSEDLTELIDALKLQMSPEGQLQPIKATGKLVISDAPDRVAAVKALLESIFGTVENQVFVSRQTDGTGVGNNSPSLPPSQSSIEAIELRPQYIMASDLLQPLTMIVGEGSVSIVEQENIVVVFGDETVQQKARQLMHQIDRPRPQVRITGYIYDVDLKEIEKLGVDWNQQVMSQALDANGIPRNLSLSQGGLLTPNPPNNAASIVTGIGADTATAAAGAAGAAGAATAAAGGTGGQFLFRTLNSNFELQTMIQALDQSDGSRLLADPHVTVVDRHQASLGIVTKIPVQQLTQTQQGGSIGTTSFQDAGITLDVTPRIAADGTIEMEVSPEFSVLSGFQQGNPIIDTRRASTTVRVNHGQALVIGGLRSKTAVETVKGIPGLMNIKYLGRLFSSHDTEVRESELIVFIMPEIVGYCGGLEREMHALEVQQAQLSRISTAVDGPFSPDCNDKHCPQHHPRPRIHNGMEDRGLVGAFDPIFINPMPATIYEPVMELPSRETVLPAEPLPMELPQPSPNATSKQEAFSQVKQAAPVALQSSEPKATAASLASYKSSRRTQAKPATYRRPANKTSSR